MSLFTARVDTKVTISQTSEPAYPARSVSPSFSPAASQYGSGTSAAQVAVGHMKAYSIPFGSPQSIDLSGGSIDDLLGEPASFAKVNTLALYNDGPGNVVVTGNFMTSRFGSGFSYTLTPMGRLVVDNPTVAGETVTNATGDTITLTSSSGTPSVRVAIGGR